MRVCVCIYYQQTGIFVTLTCFRYSRVVNLNQNDIWFTSLYSVFRLKPARLHNDSADSGPDLSGTFCIRRSTTTNNKNLAI